MDWKEAYHLPLHCDAYAPFIVWTNNSKRAFDFCSQKVNFKELIDIINGITRSTDDGYTYSQGIVYKNSKPLMRIRGWGYLTGLGVNSLHLNPGIAASIQDAFANYIIKRLNHEI